VTIDELRSRLTAACDALVAKGWRIAPLMSAQADGKNDCCCPLGAALLVAGSQRWQDRYPSYFPAFADTFPCGTTQFVNGFESPVIGPQPTDPPPLWLLGREFRAKYFEEEVSP